MRRRLSTRWLWSGREHLQAAAAAAAPLQKLTLHKRGGLISWLFGSSKKRAALAPVLPPLQDPLPGVKLSPELHEEQMQMETKVSKLSNGLTVASEDRLEPTATVGLYVDSGSIYETQFNSGLTHLLERMAFKSTVNRSHQRLIREMEAIGANVVASASREQMCYTGDVIKTYVPEIVEILADAVRNPAFLEWEIKEQVATLKDEIKNLEKNPQSLVLEALHPAGYKGALGKPLMASEARLEKLDSRALHQFVAENFTASRMVLAGSGVGHEYLVSLAEPLFKDMPLVAPPPAVKSEYVGGECRIEGECDHTHVAAVFEVPGGWRNQEDSVAATVLQALLGGGGSFSMGGPGKGVHSRLYTRVLQHYSKVESFTALTSMFNDSGLFGIQASSEPDYVVKLVDLISKELLLVATPGKVSEAELERAKNATISLVLMNLESRVIVNEDIGRQILTYGCRKPAHEFIESVQRLTLDDLCNTAEKIISTPLTMACFGEVSKVPRVDIVSKRFQ